MRKDHSENQATLENSPWQRSLGIYLERSVMVTANLSTLFFLSVIEVYFLKNLTDNLFVRLAYFILCYCYGMLVTKVAVKVVGRYYKPSFVSEMEFKPAAQIKSNTLILSPADYSYRLRVEKLIFETLICYGVYLISAILFYNLGRVLGGKYPNSIGNNIGFGLAGGLVSFLNLFGVGVLGAASSSRSFLDKIICLFFGFCFILPQIGYIVWAIYSFLIR